MFRFTVLGIVATHRDVQILKFCTCIDVTDFDKRSASYIQTMIQTQHGESRKVGIVRERARTADSIGEYLTLDYRVIKAEPAPSPYW